MADAMYAPVVTRFLTYDVKLAVGVRAPTAGRIVTMPEMIEWIAAAKKEPMEIEELEAEF